MSGQEAEHGAATAEVARLVRHAEYLRQINSNKAFALERRSRWMTVATVVVAAAITFVGFAGTAKLHDQLNSILGWSQQAIELAYNCLILSVLLVTIIALIYRLPERAAQHEHAIQDLTRFIRENEAAVRAAESGAIKLSLEDSRIIEEKYLTLSAALPPSTDKQFLKAKRDYARKRKKSKVAERSVPAELLAFVRKRILERLGVNVMEDSKPAPGVQPPLRGLTGSDAGAGAGDRLDEIVRASPQTMAILALLREERQQDLWLAGGAVRNLVWDALHGYTVSTPVEDIDVVWFDSDSTDAGIDHKLEARLSAKAPNLVWDVKNQARMPSAKELGARSLEEAMKVWPEKATAVAIRLDEEKLTHVAPFGLDDLFSLKLGPPSGAEESRFRQRLAEKRWVSKWPKLRVEEPSSESAEERHTELSDARIDESGAASMGGGAS